MTFSKKINRLNTVFLDTAPIIYYIEAHPHFGNLVMEVVNAFQSGEITAFSSVLTLTEVLSKPLEVGNEQLAKRFVGFLNYSENLNLLEISAPIAEKAGRLRGQYPNLKTMDALQISAAICFDIDAFVTNDVRLKQIKGIDIIVLKDYL
ncbi:MAG: PIN domain-containing protein [Candidatus Schekmanbacteria bacterium]|nr:PIN domain-containing protein [Candidatus Schekmanbacteria bacterium]